MSVDQGERLKNVRKRQGLSQRELAEASGVSYGHLRKIEQGEREPRLETLRKLAVGLRVRTSDIHVNRDAEYADAETEDLWEPVRRALVGKAPTADEAATVEGVRREFKRLRGLIGTNRYAEIAASLPGLLRDADQIEDEGRMIRTRILDMTGWLLTQNRQFDAAESVLRRAIDTAPDRGDAAAAVNTMTWALLRQGRLAEARDLAIRWADDIEPRFSRATTAELASWGRLWLTVANAAVRDNSPGEAEDALSLARAAAERIGGEIYADSSTARTFGPITVSHIVAETHVIAEQPELALAVIRQTPAATLQAVGANRLRHRLDKANAYGQLGQFPEAIEEIQRTWAIAPEWLVQQRYARDILGKIIAKRRTLTVEMRDLADKIKLEY